MTKTKPTAAAVTAVDPVDLVPVADAAHASGVPRSTIFRWITTRRVRARTADGVQVVSIGEVLDAKSLLAAARGKSGSPAAGLGTSLGSGADPGSRPGRSAPTLTPEDYGALFELFEENVPSIKIVADFGFTPDEVAFAREKYAKAKEADSTRPTEIDQTIADLTARVEVLEGLPREIERACASVRRVVELEKRVVELEKLMDFIVRQGGIRA